MNAYRELAPHPALRRLVDRFWVSSVDAGAPARRILPDGCIDVLIDFEHGGRTLVVGTMTRALVFKPRAPVRTAAVRFRPGAAVRFLGVTADELTDRTLPCAEIGARWLADAPWGEFTHSIDAVETLQRLLLGRLASIEDPDPVVAHAVTSLFARDTPSIEALSREIGWSRQHLARKFHSQVGVSPKQLARVARLQRAVADLQRASGSGMAGDALRFGYFDQAHMARDFRALADVTPAEAQGGAGSIFPIRSLFADP
jgi:AraC-like DNA-binding protein